MTVAVMTRRTVYCVQPYAGASGRLIQCGLREFGDELAARREGETLSARRAGVLVFAVSGEPDFGTWEEPRILAAYGSTPMRVSVPPR